MTKARTIILTKMVPEFLHDATRILIPGLAGPYIGSLTDGHIPDIGINNPAWPTSPNPYFVWSVGNSANNSIWLVQNTLGRICFTVNARGNSISWTCC